MNKPEDPYPWTKDWFLLGFLLLAGVILLIFKG